MSSPRKTTSQAKAKDRRRPPFMGAMLRLAYQALRRRQMKALVDEGFADLNQALLNVLVYPPPDGARPTDLADRCYMTKQAMNHLLGQLEALGYIERRAENGSNRRLVYLTRRGWQVFETQWATMQQCEADWSAVIGKKRFDDFLSTLRQLSLLDSKAGPQRQLPDRH